MTDDPARVTQRAYDATALRYRERWHHIDPLTEAKAGLSRFLPPGGRVLDVGCGTGRDLAWFAARGFQAIGLDRSTSMLALTEGSALLVSADMRLIPLPDASVDGWWASASLLHLRPDGLRQTLTELARVTRPRGIGFLSVKQGNGDGLERVAGSDHARYFCYWQPRTLDPALRGTSWRIKSAWTSADSLGRAPWLCRLVTLARSRRRAAG